MIIVDAFSSDAIPVHLLTNEAFGLYEDHLTEHGVLAVHITNRCFAWPTDRLWTDDRRNVLDALGQNKG